MSRRIGMAMLAAGLFTFAAQADIERSFQIAGDQLALANLIGEIRVSGKSGGDIEVVVKVQGEAASEDLIQFEQNDGELFILFPIEEHDSYVYPRLGGGSRSQIRFRTERKHSGDRSVFDSFFEAMGGDQIEIRGSGRGLELWADVEILVPAGKKIQILNGVGELEAESLATLQLVLDTQAGSIEARTIQGELICDTGSGHVDVDGVQGAVSIDTGSGHVEASDIEGEAIEIDTGSGHVTLQDAKASEVRIDTGSGKVEIRRVDTMAIEVDTGSGGVEAMELATDKAHIDTGSGSVRLELTRVGDGDYDVSTGSGGIHLILPEDASATVYAEAGSGGVDIDVSDIRTQRIRRDSAEFEMGEGEAQIDLETGSGGIRIVGR